MNGVFFRLAGMLLAWATVPGVAHAGTVSGDVRLVDGDTLIVSGTTVRLHGIDAPETGQTCQDARGRAYRCGQRATDALAKMIGERRVRCVGDEHDRYGRLVATCHAGGVNLNAEMVRLGLAVAFRRYSDDYLAEEIEAFKAARGLWSGTFQRPVDARTQSWEEAKSRAPAGCPIKGNISANGRIYHTPWSRHYARTRINPARGERWFCSEAEAIAAGWRPPIR